MVLGGRALMASMAAWIDDAEVGDVDAGDAEAVYTRRPRWAHWRPSPGTTFENTLIFPFKTNQVVASVPRTWYLDVKRDPTDNSSLPVTGAGATLTTTPQALGQTRKQKRR